MIQKTAVWHQALRSSHRTPWHWNQDAALHRLNERNSLMDRLSPALDAPALLTPHLPLFEIRKLPEMVHSVQLPNLYEPRPDAFHDFSAGLQPSPPVSLPFEQVARMKSVRSQFEETPELAWRCGGPERKFLHQRSLFGIDEGLELRFVCRVLGMMVSSVQGRMIAMVSLVFPNMNCTSDQLHPGQLYVRVRCLPNVSQSPTSVLQLPTRCTLCSGTPAMYGYHPPMSSTYSSTLSGFTS